MPEFSVLWLLLAALLPAFLLLLRLLYVLPCFRLAADNSKKLLKGSIMVLLGSGGHTGEMLRMLAPVPLGNCSRTWIVSSGDTTSLEKARAYEEKLETLDGKSSSTFVQLPRARRVGELPLLSVVSTVVSIAATAQKIWALGPPDVLLVNGPGTSVVLAYVLFAMKFLGLGSTRIVYIESLARVKLLSLSGRLIFPIADRFVVQWKELAIRYHRAEYHGILV